MAVGPSSNSQRLVKRMSAMKTQFSSRFQKVPERIGLTAVGQSWSAGMCEFANVVVQPKTVGRLDHLNVCTHRKSGQLQSGMARPAALAVHAQTDKGKRAHDENAI